MIKEQMKEVKKVWGKELIVVNCDKYCGKILYLDQGAKPSLHYHKEKQETFYCLEGQVALTIEGKDYMLNPFSRPKTIKPGQLHNFTGLTNAVIIEISTHHDDQDVYRLTKSKPAEGNLEDINFSTVGIAHEDERRKLSAIFNGDFIAKQVKLLEVKKASILGNHYHHYSELFYVLRGKATYTLRSIKTGKTKTVKLKEGDRLIIGSEVVHKAEISKGTVMIEATETPYQPSNDIKYEVN